MCGFGVASVFKDDVHIAVLFVICEDLCLLCVDKQRYGNGLAVILNLSLIHTVRIRGRDNLHVSQLGRRKHFILFLVVNQNTDDIARFNFSGEAERIGADGDTDRLVLRIKGSEDTVGSFYVIADLGRQNIVACGQICESKFADDLCFIGNNARGEIITADLNDLNIGFGDDCACSHILGETDDLCFSVRKFIDKRCDTKANGKSDRNANDSDDCAVAHGMGSALFFLFHV